MGYKNFGKTKTIVLPSPSVTITYAQYKETYGIDLKDIFELGNEEIYYKRDVIKNSMILIQSEPISGYAYPLYPAGILDIVQNYSSGVSDLQATLFSCPNPDESSYEGLIFELDKDADFTFENLTIRPVVF